MARDLSRLFQPSSIAVVGGGAWCLAVIEQCEKIGFAGEIWPVYPRSDAVAGYPAFRSVAELPGAPDATFIGVNRDATVQIVQALAQRGAGGAVCFASGFLEAQAEDAVGSALQDALLRAAGNMPILGPNCYGFINYLDGALLWPDQHGGQRCESGVAIVTQSSNIAINLTMQARALPIAYVVTAGNQAQTGLAEIGLTLLEDPRVTALGLHIEGIGDLAAFERLARKARELGKAIVAIKVGASSQARAAAVSHTASLAGGNAGADALFRRLGIARAPDLPTFLETLKLLHTGGHLAGPGVASISCSGGEASLSADTGLAVGATFPALTQTQLVNLRDALGPRVALANPLDYHTYIWRDVDAMTRAFAAMSDPAIAITLLIVDFPRADRCSAADWDCAIEATIAAARQTARRYAMVATLPELMPEGIAQRLMAAGVVPFAGLTEALAACAIGIADQRPVAAPLLLPTATNDAVLVPEAEAKTRLAAHGLAVPTQRRCLKVTDVGPAARAVGFPVVVKGEGIAHKTEASAVALGLMTEKDAVQAAGAMPVHSWLVERMITDPVAELLIGVLRDPAHGFVLTLAAGGTLTELLQDSVSLLVPASPDAVLAALNALRIAPVLRGYRGAPPANMPRILAAIEAVQNYTIANAATLHEIEINPLICTQTDAIAADALLRQSD